MLYDSIERIALISFMSRFVFKQVKINSLNMFTLEQGSESIWWSRAYCKYLRATVIVLVFRDLKYLLLFRVYHK